MTCKCGNEARYIAVTGALTCAICPIRAGVDSIKLASVPDLLREVRGLLSNLVSVETDSSTDERARRIRAIIGRAPGESR